MSAVLRLVARCGDQVRCFPIGGSETSVGSAAGNDIVLPFPGVSRRHASIRRLGRDLLFLDLGSKNGLVVAGKPLPQALLSLGDEIRLGRVALRLEEVSASEAEVGLTIDLGEATVGRPQRAPSSTSSLELTPTDRTARMALRFVRDLERGGGSLADSYWLSAARRILGAASLLIFRQKCEQLVVVACHGPLPPEPWRWEWDEKSALFSQPAKPDDLCLAALFPPGCSPVAWEKDFFDYLAQRLGAGQPFLAESKRSAAILRLPPEMIVGESTAFEAMLADLDAAVRSRMDVLLLGETGTGKELLARAIHASGPTAKGPFVAVNCAAIPSELLEAELFGVQAKVATDVEPRQGLIWQAQGGTMFLDEIGELAVALQAKLLRVLQEREIRPLGAAQPQKIQVRFVSATNRDLASLVEAGTFRRDLYFRLRGFEVQVPPLRDLREDLPHFISDFVARAAVDYGKRIAGVSRRALTRLIEHPWPGNIRELQDEVRRAVSRCPDGGVLESGFFTLQRTGDPPPEIPSEPPSLPSSPPPRTLEERVDDLEREAIRDALAQSGGNKTRAAKILGLTRNGLNLKLKRLGL